MPPRRSTGPGANPLDLVISLIGLFFGGRAGGKQRAALFSAGVVAAAVIFTGGWYLFQSGGRKAEVRRLIANSQESRKHIKITQVIWDIWTLYFSRPFVPAHVDAGQGSLLLGEPQRTSFPHEIRTLYNAAYTVGYCDDLGDPAWVGYRVFDMNGHVTPPKRPQGFFLDPRTSARIESAFYSESGYDRGHMAPNYAIGTRYGVAAQEETFKMSNVCPQRHRLNAGLWKDLEAKIADNYTGRYGQVWVIDGPVFGPEDRLQRLRGRVAVPPQFYMIVLQQHEGGVRAQAFVLDQEAPSSGSLDPYLTTVADIEHRTGLSFFPKLDAKAQRELAEQKPSSVW